VTLTKNFLGENTMMPSMISISIGFYDIVHVLEIKLTKMMQGATFQSD
jgi:hypothetical protein